MSEPTPVDTLEKIICKNRKRITIIFTLANKEKALIAYKVDNKEEVRYISRDEYDRDDLCQKYQLGKTIYRHNYIH